MSYSVDQFTADVMKFRELFGDRRNSLDTLEAAFRGLTHAFMQTRGTPQEEETATAIYQATTNEWTRRRTLMFMRH